MARCRSCQQPVIWAITRYGKRMAFNRKPRGDGQWILVHGNPNTPPSAVHLTREQIADRQLEAVIDGKPWHGLMIPHAATCPEAKGWRKGPRKGAAA